MRVRTCRIVVAGSLDPSVAEELAPMSSEYSDGETTLTGEMDSSAMYGMLERVRYLGLELLAVRRGT